LSKQIFSQTQKGGFIVSKPPTNNQNKKTQMREEKNSACELKKKLKKTINHFFPELLFSLVTTGWPACKFPLLRL
jgi:hypothetical protein